MGGWLKQNKPGDKQVHGLELKGLLEKELAALLGMPKRKAGKLVDIVAGVMAAALQRGDTIHIRHLGMFKLYNRKGCFHGEDIYGPTYHQPRRIVKFIPARDIRNALKGREEE